MHFYTVAATNPKGHRKQLSVVDAGKRQFSLVVPRFSAVGKGDTVAVDLEHPSNIFVVSRVIRICLQLDFEYVTCIS